jgi:pimeloyl-ACP methyl ester carboxylesterase
MESRQFDLTRRSLLKWAGAAAAVTTATAATHRAASAASPRTAELFYTEAGSGRNVMLVHGWSCDSHDWITQLPTFESKYRVVAPDLRGHGRSEVMPSGAYMPTDYVADLEALISSKYPGEEFIIVGHSMGAQIATRLAAQRPDLVSAVVSVDGALGFDSNVGQAFSQFARELEAGDPAALVPAFFQSAYDPATNPMFKSLHARRVMGMPRHVVRESFGPLFSGPGQIGIGEQSARFLSTLTVPFYHLARDPAQADRMRPWSAHQKSKVDAWASAGHWIMQDRPDEVNAAIVEWIDSL